MNARDAIDLHWRKSSYSGTGNGDCVEVAAGTAGAAVRDSKDAASGYIELPSTSWAVLRSHLASRRSS